MATSKVTEAISPIRAIAIILAHGVVRLHQRQKELDNRTEQSNGMDSSAPSGVR